MTDPTHPVLTEAQADGLACVHCNLDYTTHTVPSVPVGMVGGGQVFACAATCIVCGPGCCAPIAGVHTSCPGPRAGAAAVSSR